jgi:hypothetical protein
LFAPLLVLLGRTSQNSKDSHSKTQSRRRKLQSSTPGICQVSHVNTTLRLTANPSRREPQWSRLPIRSQWILTLLLVVLGKRALAFTDGSLVDLNAGMSVFEHHAAVRGAFFAVFGEFGLLRTLDGEWTMGFELTSDCLLV